MRTCEACGREYEGRIVTHGTTDGRCPYCDFGNELSARYKTAPNTLSIDMRDGKRLTVPRKVYRVLPPKPESTETPLQRGDKRTYRGDRKAVFSAFSTDQNRDGREVHEPERT